MIPTRPFRLLRNLGRTREIATVLFIFGFDDLLDRLHLRRYLQIGKRFVLRQRQEAESHRTRAERVRLVLEHLGPTFIKFGQVISTRPDMLPSDIIEELSKLQEHVPPFSSELARSTIERELGAPIEQIFTEFEAEPIAAASLGQVHRARLPDGRVVAVKIRRPNVVHDIERDLALMFDLASLLDRHVPEAETFDPLGLVNHFARTIRRELNFAREARTMDEFRRLFRDDATMIVPEVCHELTTDAVLTMTYVRGIKLDDRETMNELGIDAREVAANGARILMRQAFEFGLFHGDPHPGNIRIMPDGSICLFDHGMVGMIDEEKREQLVDLFQAVAKQDARLATRVILMLGEPVRPVDEPLLRADVRDFVENYYGIPLERMRIGKMLTDFVAILSRHCIRCPADLMLLIRSLIALEGMARDLDPNFNMAEHLAPFIEKVIRDRYNPKRLATRLFDETRMFLNVAHDVPLQLGRTLEKLSRDRLKLQMEHRGLETLASVLDRSSNRIVIGVLVSSMIVASSLIIRRGSETLWLSVPIYLISSLLGVWLIYGVFRSGRL